MMFIFVFIGFEDVFVVCFKKEKYFRYCDLIFFLNLFKKLGINRFKWLGE